MPTIYHNNIKYSSGGGRGAAQLKRLRTRQVRQAY